MTNWWNGQPIFAHWIVRFAINFRRIFRCLTNVYCLNKYSNCFESLHLLGSTVAELPLKFWDDWRTLHRNLVRSILREILGYNPLVLVENKQHISDNGFIVISDHSIYEPPKCNTDHTATHQGWSVGRPRILDFWQHWYMCVKTKHKLNYMYDSPGITVT